MSWTPGGEVTAIDSAGFGPITITQSVTITSPNGVEAGIVPTAGGDAVTISPTAKATITLRGLTLGGSGVGQNGIVYNAKAGGALNIIGCVVKDFTGDGIMLTPNFQAIEGTFVSIADSSILNNAGNGIEINPQSSLTNIVFAIDRTSLEDNGASNLSTAGILVNTAASGPIIGTISSSHAASNGSALSLIGTGAGANVRVRNSVFILSTVAADAHLNASNGTVYLYSNQIDYLNNAQGTAYSDGNNNIGIATGNALTSHARQ